jgi:hypothetical protein
MALVARGETTVDEVRRVVAEPARPDAAQPTLWGSKPPIVEARGTALVRATPVSPGPPSLDQLDAIILALLRWRSGR